MSEKSTNQPRCEIDPVMGMLSKVFLGETIRETLEIYRSVDEKDRISIGLFRNSVSDVVWLKFWQKSPIMGSSGMGVAIAVDSFADFDAFLSAGCDPDPSLAVADARVSFIPRLIYGIGEGMTGARCIGEYRCAADPMTCSRMFIYQNRRGCRRVLFQHNNHFSSMDFEALEAIRDFFRDASPAGLIRDAV